jgi:Protein of unknown function (DUF2786)
MTKEQVIERVRKLLALSNSPNINEAARASEKARALLEKYRLTQEDLHKDERDRRCVILESKEDYEAADWLGVLLKAIEVNNDVVVLVKKRTKGRVAIHILSDEASSTISLDMFRYLHDSACKRAETEYKHLKQMRYNVTDNAITAFKVGFANGVLERIMIQRVERLQREETEAKMAESALVIREHIKLRDEIKEALKGRIEESSDFSESIIDGYGDVLMGQIGYYAGHKVSLKKQLEDGSVKNTDFLP